MHLLEAQLGRVGRREASKINTDVSCWSNIGFMGLLVVGGFGVHCSNTITIYWDNKGTCAAKHPLNTLQLEVLRAWVYG